MEKKQKKQKRVVERFDCHCHIFNLTTVGWKAVIEQLSDIVSLLYNDNDNDNEGKDGGKKASVSKRISAFDRNKIKENLRRMREMVKFFTSDSSKIFEMLDSHYNKEYKLFPMMIDGDYVLDINNDDHLIKIDSFLQSISSKFHMRKDGFDAQYEQIKAIADNPKYKDRFFPFLGVDPRRPEIKEYLQQVGKGKLFAGIKVYPPNGFSPYDNVLTGKDSIFEYCSKNAIPVVSHCSYGGFSSPSMSLNINGLIMLPGDSKPSSYNGRYTFSNELKKGYLEMVRERAEVLNHPKIWNEVLKKYPDLILVLAHFGNGSEVWQDEILEMLKIYPNLYTDVSCMSKKETIIRVKNIHRANPDIRHKILYGSDYFMDLFMTESFEKYLNTMKSVFGKQIFDQISSKNPSKFMAKWYKITK